MGFTHGRIKVRTKETLSRDLEMAMEYGIAT
jgi:hypothetical protein